MNTRKLGLKYCQEVKGILRVDGHQVEGPMTKTLFIGGKMIPVHYDLFGAFDLLSITPEGDLQLHQVSVLEHKAEKLRVVQASKIAGFVWLRFKNIHIFYQVYFVFNNTVELYSNRSTFYSKGVKKNASIHNISS